MSHAKDRTEFAPPPQRGTLRALGLALIAHVLLIAALTWGVHWKRDTESDAVEAEIWSSTVQEAAPRLSAPPETAPPPPPKPTPAPVPKPAPAPAAKPQPPPPPQAVKTPEPPAPRAPDIALEREKKLKLQRERELAEEREEKKQDAKEQAAKDAAKKAALAKKQEEAEDRAEEAADRKAAEKQKLADAKKKQDADAKKADAAERKEDALAKQKADAAAAKLADAKQKSDAAAKQAAEGKKADAADRAAQLKRLQGMAGNGSDDSKGTAQKSSGPSGSYGGKVAAAVRPNVVFPDADLVNGNPMAEFDVRLAPDGTIVGTPKLVKSSGLPAWDEAALRALQKTDKLPRDIDGRVPPALIVGLKPKR